MEVTITGTITHEFKSIDEKNKFIDEFYPEIPIFDYVKLYSDLNFIKLF